MSPIKPDEKRFEDYIEKQLIDLNYSSKDFRAYDRELCLVKEDVINFIKDSQPNKWDNLKSIYGIQTEKKVLERISSEISKRGINDVLRNPVKDSGQYIDLCYFKPKSDLNPDHLSLYKKNNFLVIRQLHFSKRNEKSIDMGLFVNGLPLIN